MNFTFTYENVAHLKILLFVLLFVAVVLVAHAASMCVWPRRDDG